MCFSRDTHVNVLWILGLLLYIGKLRCQDYPSSEKKDQRNNWIWPDDVGFDYGEGYAFYDIPTEEKPEPATCYTCHFSKTSGHAQGMSNCDEPFNATGIPTINCKGSCATTKTTLGDGEYMIIRSCLPRCKDLREPHSSVNCCSGSNCNGSKADMEMMVTIAGAFGFVLTIGLLIAMCYHG